MHSVDGCKHHPVHQLRDPFVYEDDGRVYLFYSVAGEQGIGLAEIIEDDVAEQPDRTRPGKASRTQPGRSG